MFLYHHITPYFGSPDVIQEGESADPVTPWNHPCIGIVFFVSFGTSKALILNFIHVILLSLYASFYFHHTIFMGLHDPKIFI